MHTYLHKTLLYLSFSQLFDISSFVSYIIISSAQSRFASCNTYEILTPCTEICVESELDSPHKLTPKQLAKCQLLSKRTYIAEWTSWGRVALVTGWRYARHCLAKLAVLHSLFVLEITHMHICKATYTFYNIILSPQKVAMQVRMLR